NSDVDLGAYYDYSDFGRWTNSGSISVTGGSLTLGSQNIWAGSLDSWSNPGTITATDAAVRLYGRITTGDFGNVQRTGGSISLSATIDHTGASIDAIQGALLHAHVHRA